MIYLADHEVNRGRQPEIDCLKAVYIFFMIFLYVFEECTEGTSGVCCIITIIECLTGAGAFMLCIGTEMYISQIQTTFYIRR